LEVSEYFAVAEFGLSKDTVDERDRHLLDLVAHVLRADDDLHLEDVAAALDLLEGHLEHLPLVEAEGAREIRCRRGQEGRCQEVGHARSKLAVQIPAVDASVLRVASPGHDVRARLPLLLDKLGDHLRVVAQVRVHQDNKVTRALGQAVHVGRAQTQLARACVQLDLSLAVYLLQVLHHILGAIGGIVIHDDYLHVDFAIDLNKHGLTVPLRFS